MVLCRTKYLKRKYFAEVNIKKWPKEIVSLKLRIFWYQFKPSKYTIHYKQAGGKYNVIFFFLLFDIRANRDKQLVKFDDDGQTKGERIKQTNSSRNEIFFSFPIENNRRLRTPLFHGLFCMSIYLSRYLTLICDSPFEFGCKLNIFVSHTSIGFNDAYKL